MEANYVRGVDSTIHDRSRPNHVMANFPYPRRLAPILPGLAARDPMLLLREAPGS